MGSSWSPIIARWRPWASIMWRHLNFRVRLARKRGSAMVARRTSRIVFSPCRPCIESISMTVREVGFNDSETINRGHIDSDSIMVRAFEDHDIESVIEMGRQEWPNLWPELPYDAEHIRRLLVWHLTNENCGGWVLVDEQNHVCGFFGLCITPALVTKELMADETWWYVDPL